jgi:hypothetical protein
VKVERLWENAWRQPSIRYVDVLASAYDTKHVDLAKCLLAKKAYRDTVAKNRVFFCNYGAVNNEIKIKWRSTRADTMNPGRIKEGGTVEKGAGFDYRTGMITLSPEAPLQALLHASGSALSGFPSKKALDAAKAFINADKKDKRFADCVRLELQMQDLNRYFATFSSQPIMTPLEALRALTMLGHKPDRELVKKIYARYPIRVSEEELDRALAAPVVKRDGRKGVFEHANRLIDGVSALGTEAFGDDEVQQMVQVENGLNQMKQEEYEALLEKILMEAPGHM